MAFSSEVERQRYSQQLAEYTLRQFSAARLTLDKDGMAAAKIPASQRNKIARWMCSRAQVRGSPSRSDSTLRPVAA
ncbi:hypothetical protein E1B28_000276 [Marasmius oreades]|uniref:Uncharacterized protein n=1 Tax=Marasmius oreades TaxID=181124 RepID=A0A9P7V165_9AGAR|nr:uncharacterized protein E1B28_000276 [Marasmius oreades]KAG7098315.1 hypothetical protein E1B28_000276 [Marasmius oreades]